MRLIIPAIIIFTVLWVVEIALAEQTVHSRLERTYGLHLDQNDPMAWPMKVNSLASGPYKFWRGSKDLFFLWAADHCRDWLADESSYGVTHGDPHLGNIGTYASEGRWGELALGMVDFDDTARLPTQLELLQGMITLRLVAVQNGIPLDEPAATSLCRELLSAYASAHASGRTATRLLSDDRQVAALMARASRPYDREIDEYVSGSRFKTVVRTAKGRVKELLRPADDTVADAVATGLADAIRTDPQLAKRFRIHDRDSLRSAILDVTWRTRIASSGSQGLKKILVLLESPLVDRQGPTLLYLKQSVPAAAERTGVIPLVRAQPSRRLIEHARALQEPDAFVGGWCVIDRRAYWISFKEPWSDEFDPDEIDSLQSLTAAARIWGTVAGSAHAAAGAPDVTADPHLSNALVRRSRAYADHNRAIFESFRMDPRTVDHQAAVSRLIADAIQTP